MASTKADTIKCAACGKEGGDSLKACTACKLVKYCNRDCQIAHRPLHKKICKKRAAELHDEALFKEPPPLECPICFLPLPLEPTRITFKSCCGKIICKGCIDAMTEEARGRRKIDLCAFCRTPGPTSVSETVKRLNKLIECNNSYGYFQLAGYYANGELGMPLDWSKANELYLKAGELGCARGYYNLGMSYDRGVGVEVDKKKAKHYYELAAMNGSVLARYYFGIFEGKAGNEHRAMKHFILAARAGDKDSLDKVKDGFMDDDMVTKDEYESTLRAYKQRHDEMKSEGRDIAEAFYEERDAAGQM